MASATCVHPTQSPINFNVVKSAMVMAQRAPEPAPSPQPSVDTSNIALLKAFIERLQQTLPKVKYMTCEHAQNALNGLDDPFLAEVLVEMRAATALPLPDGATEEDALFYRMSEMIVAIRTELAIVADETPVDEDSPGYRAFLKKMVADAEVEPAVFGRKALFALFEN